MFILDFLFLSFITPFWFTYITRNHSIEAFASFNRIDARKANVAKGAKGASNELQNNKVLLM